MKKLIHLIVIIIVIILITKLFTQEDKIVVTNFEECIAAGNPAMESWPRQCISGDQTFIEVIDIISEAEQAKNDLIRLESIHEGDSISSPLTITGEARGTWFFEGDFPVILTDWDGLIIAEGIAQAHPPAGGEWMGEDFVPFEGTLEFDKPEYKDNGTLIFQKDNPSDSSENDDALEISIIFE